MTTPTTDPLLDGVVACLVEMGRRRLAIGALLDLLVEVRPELAVSSERYTRLATLLGELEQIGAIEGSKSRAPLGGVMLPTSVKVLVTQRTTGTRNGQAALQGGGRRGAPGQAPNSAQRFPWVPEMAWVAGGRRRSAQQMARFQALSTWIAAHRGARPVAPVRERSLEIFGEDKVLEALLDGPLRARADVATALAVERPHPPMALGRIDGAGDAALVVENGTTFHSVLHAARRHVAMEMDVAFGWVGFGVGEQVSAIIGSLIEVAPSAVYYFGDLDPEGLRFPAAAAERCAGLGLPELRPAVDLYEALLDRGKPQHRPHRADWPAAGLAWLGEDLATELLAVLGPEQWLAQEWVTRELLLTDPTWCALG